MTKKCSKCGEVKPKSEFYPDKSKKNGIQSHCKDCCRETKRMWRACNLDKSRAQTLKWRKEHPDGHRGIELKRKYGLTLIEYDQMTDEQDGVCAISKKVCSTGRRLAVDHCHSTGRVRGLLTANINRALGLFEDNPEWLRRAADYLESHQKEYTCGPS